MSKVLVILAQDCEELEAVTIIDILRRANVDVVTAGLDSKPVKASRGVQLIPDTTLDNALKQQFTMVVLPGGLPGADNLGNDPRVVAFLKQMAADGQWLAAVCAAPRVLARAALLDGKRATAYPGFIDTGEFPGIEYTGGAVEKDGRTVTSRGPGTAMDFALTLVECLTDIGTRNTVEERLVR